jgi:hypothetical protein
MATEMGGAKVIVVAEDTDLVALAVEVALMVTVLPVGTLAGAVNVVVASLAVCATVNEPQLALPQVTLQSTPALVTSFAMCALTITEVLT